MENDQNLIETDLIIDSTISMHLKETAAWGKFLGVAGFIYSGLLGLAGIFAISTLTKYSGSYSSYNKGFLAGGAIIGIIYLGMAFVLFYMSVQLFRFAKKTQLAIQTSDQDTLAKSFNHLKFYFRFAGIITVIAIMFSVLGVIGVLMATAFSR